jgi:hypothetical protein
MVETTRTESWEVFLSGSRVSLIGSVLKLSGHRGVKMRFNIGRKAMRGYRSGGWE